MGILYCKFQSDSIVPRKQWLGAENPATEKFTKVYTLDNFLTEERGFPATFFRLFFVTIKAEKGVRE